MKSSAPLKAVFSRYFPVIAAIAGGLLYAASLPPWNWGFAVLFALLPLYAAAAGKYTWKFRTLCGWLWGVAWACFAFRFLREINWCIPWVLMLILGLWSAVFTGVLGVFSDLITRSKCQLAVKEVLFAFTAASLLAIVEWTRCKLFVWNDLSVTMWRCPEAMQIARITGRYGVTFLLALGSAGIFALRRKRAGIPAALCALILGGISLIYGAVKVAQQPVYRDPVTLRTALVQGNLPQLRRASDDEVYQAVMTYVTLTRRILDEKPDLVLWPECAVPVPLRGAIPESYRFRQELAPLLTGTPVLIGTLDFAPDRSGLTNSALLVRQNPLYVDGKYDKFHRVPFGEYVPGRKYLPEFMIEAFDMGRDLVAGDSLQPLQISQDVSIGCAVCYEGVFSYITRGFAANGANLLAVLSNDVWYPESSEPEQHLANAVMRCVETGLPMIRCGNNGGSGLVTGKGVFTQYIGSDSKTPELLREQAAGIVTVTFEREPEATWYVRFGDIWLVALAVFLSGEFAVLALPKRSGKRS